MDTYKTLFIFLCVCSHAHCLAPGMAMLVCSSWSRLNVCSRAVGIIGKTSSWVGKFPLKSESFERRKMVVRRLPSRRHVTPDERKNWVDDRKPSGHVLYSHCMVPFALPFHSMCCLNAEWWNPCWHRFFNTGFLWGKCFFGCRGIVLLSPCCDHVSMLILACIWSTASESS